ncbi:hypothetical protein GCK32_021744 [Trichostrongylus colubriformis]|uniref:Uncharacterized protein n=1 Tax=Trichostrongylus colubriformis TaxID=6319 RepID=A0AAN8F9P7_TRICO
MKACKLRSNVPSYTEHSPTTPDVLQHHRIGNISDGMKYTLSFITCCLTISYRSSSMLTAFCNKLLQKDQSSVGSHINVVDGRGNTVALSSSLNERFGSVRRSMKGGFVWNNEMSSFTMPDKEKSEDVHVNAIEGRKRPRTSMMPLMLFDYGGQVMLSL